jgi:hypothetical protein
MGRLISSVVVGFLAFNLIAFLVANAVGAVWPAIAAIEDPRDYTMQMLWFRLTIGAAGVFVSGTIAGIVSRRGAYAGLVMGIVFELVFLPVHLLVLYEDFPAWYHAVFLIYVVPVTWLGGRLAGSGSSAVLASPPAL